MILHPLTPTHLTPALPPSLPTTLFSVHNHRKTVSLLPSHNIFQNGFMEVHRNFYCMVHTEFIEFSLQKFLWIFSCYREEILRRTFLKPTRNLGNTHKLIVASGRSFENPITNLQQVFCRTVTELTPLPPQQQNNV